MKWLKNCYNSHLKKIRPRTLRIDCVAKPGRWPQSLRKQAFSLAGRGKKKAHIAVQRGSGWDQPYSLCRMYGGHSEGGYPVDRRYADQGPTTRGQGETAARWPTDRSSTSDSYAVDSPYVPSGPTAGYSERADRGYHGHISSRDAEREKVWSGSISREKQLLDGEPQRWRENGNRYDAQASVAAAGSGGARTTVRNDYSESWHGSRGSSSGAWKSDEYSQRYGTTAKSWASGLPGAMEDRRAHESERVPARLPASQGSYADSRVSNADSRGSYADSRGSYADSQMESVGERSRYHAEPMSRQHGGDTRKSAWPDTYNAGKLSSDRDGREATGQWHGERRRYDPPVERQAGMMSEHTARAPTHWPDADRHWDEYRKSGRQDASVEWSRESDAEAARRSRDLWVERRRDIHIEHDGSTRGDYGDRARERRSPRPRPERRDGPYDERRRSADRGHSDWSADRSKGHVERSAYQSKGRGEWSADRSRDHSDWSKQPRDRERPKEAREGTRPSAPPVQGESMDLDDGDEETATDDANTADLKVCPEHSDEKLKLYCTVCNVFICFECLADKHTDKDGSQHETIAVKLALKQQQDWIGQMAEYLGGTLAPRAYSGINNVDAVWKDLAANAEAARRHIRAHIFQQARLLEDHFMAKINAVERDRGAVLGDQRHQLNTQISTLRDVLAECQSVLNPDSDSPAVMMSCQNVQQRLLDVQGMVIEEEARETEFLAWRANDPFDPDACAGGVLRTRGAYGPKCIASCPGTMHVLKNREAFIRLEMYDRFGQKITDSGDHIQALWHEPPKQKRRQPPKVSMVDHGDGAYTLSFTFTTQKASVYQLNVLANDLHVSGSPFNINKDIWSLVPALASSDVRVSPGGKQVAARRSNQYVVGNMGFSEGEHCWKAEFKGRRYSIGVVGAVDASGGETTDEIQRRSWSLCNGMTYEGPDKDPAPTTDGLDFVQVVYVTLDCDTHTLTLSSQPLNGEVGAEDGVQESQDGEENDEEPKQQKKVTICDLPNVVLYPLFALQHGGAQLTIESQWATDVAVLVSQVLWLAMPLRFFVFDHLNHPPPTPRFTAGCLVCAAIFFSVFSSGVCF